MWGLQRRDAVVEFTEEGLGSGVYSGGTEGVGFRKEGRGLQKRDYAQRMVQGVGVTEEGGRAMDA